MKVGVIVGRFQVPELHDGHKHLIEQVSKDNDIVLILIGCSLKSDAKNALTYEIRSLMISKQYSHPKYLTWPLVDANTDREWSDKLDYVIKLALMCKAENEAVFKINLYGSRDSFIKSYSGIHEYINVQELGEFNGTSIRDSIKPIDNKDFRMGMIYAHQMMNK